MLEKFVYHSSEIVGIKEFIPRLASYETPYVYASKDKIISIAFLTRRSKDDGDLTFWIGRNPDTNKIAIVERYKDAFKNIYDGVAGSLYELPSDTFIEGKTPWSEEVVSEQPVTPIKEIYVENVLEYLLELKRNGIIEMYEYPNRPRCVPSDDSDLIEFAKIYGPDVIKRLEKLHPHLENNLNKKLQTNL